jgi:hypothetical protein
MSRLDLMSERVRLRVVYDVPGWAYHGYASGIKKYAPPDFDVSISPIKVDRRLLSWDEILGSTPPDLLFLLDYGRAVTCNKEIRARGWSTVLMVAWSRGWPSDVVRFWPAYCVSDAVLISNLASWDRLGRLPRSYSIPYGVDGQIFKVRTPIEQRKPRVLWVGSQFFRTLKGYDDYIVPLAARLGELGIECDTRLVDSFGSDKATPAQMSDWYNSGTVLVCASESEGTPTPPIEAAACGCTIVSTRVGNMPEMIRDGVNGYLVDRSVDAILEGVLAATENYVRLATQMQEDVRLWLWYHRSYQYYQMFREVLGMDGEGAPPAPSRRPDLSTDLTVFVTTVGAPSFEACLDHLARQDTKFRLEIIEQVAPLSAALQRMLDRCETPYYVQVDEDMLLYPHAVRTLHRWMRGSPDNTAMCVGNLYDAHLGRAIQGVKIFGRDVGRRYPWTDTPVVLDRIRRMQEDGFLIHAEPVDGLDPASPSVLGLHGAVWSAEALYERSFTMESWRRAHADLVGWFAAVPPELLARFLREPTEESFLAVMGVLAAAIRFPSGGVPRKDFRLTPVLPGLATARRLFAELTAAPPEDTRPAS